MFCVLFELFEFFDFFRSFWSFLEFFFVFYYVLVTIIIKYHSLVEAKHMQFEVKLNKNETNNLIGRRQTLIQDYD